MVKLLLYIKHHLPFLWQMVDWLNAFLLHILQELKAKENPHYFNTFTFTN